MLDDSIIVTTGKLVFSMAIIEKKGAQAANKPVIAAFLQGILTGSETLNFIYTKPISQAMNIGSIFNPNGY